MPGASELARLEAEADESTTPEPGLPIPLKGPQVFGSVTIRVTLIPPEDEPDRKLLALEYEADVNLLSLMKAKLHSGTIELAITDAFGKQRTLRVSPPELIFLLQSAEKFVQELPR